MAKILYHLGTGTYFGLDDDVVVFDTDDYPASVIEDFYEGMDFTPVEEGLRITEVITGGFCLNCDKPVDKAGGYCSQRCEDFDQNPFPLSEY